MVSSADDACGMRSIRLLVRRSQSPKYRQTRPVRAWLQLILVRGDADRTGALAGAPRCPAAMKVAAGPGGGRNLARGGSRRACARADQLALTAPTGEGTVGGGGGPARFSSAHFFGSADFGIHAPYSELYTNSSWSSSCVDFFSNAFVTEPSAAPIIEPKPPKPIMAANSPSGSSTAYASACSSPPPLLHPQQHHRQR